MTITFNQAESSPGEPIQITSAVVWVKVVDDVPRSQLLCEYVDASGETKTKAFDLGDDATIRFNQ